MRMPYGMFLGWLFLFFLDFGFWILDFGFLGGMGWF